MLIFGEILHDKPTSRSMRAGAKGLALIGVLAANLLLAPDFAMSATQDVKSARMAGQPSARVVPAPDNKGARVSPYTTMNRQHAEADRALHSTSMPRSMRGQQNKPAAQVPRL